MAGIRGSMWRRARAPGAGGRSMTERNPPVRRSAATPMAPAEGPPLAGIDALVTGTVAELDRLLDTKQVVGEPMTFGGTTLIPLVSLGFGFGAGGGGGAGDQGRGGGGGGAGGGGGKPVAVIVVDAGGGGGAGAGRSRPRGSARGGRAWATGCRPSCARCAGASACGS